VALDIRADAQGILRPGVAHNYCRVLRADAI
jgi:hypothetical protein